MAQNDKIPPTVRQYVESAIDRMELMHGVKAKVSGVKVSTRDDGVSYCVAFSCSDGIARDLPVLVR